MNSKKKVRRYEHQDNYIYMTICHQIPFKNVQVQTKSKEFRGKNHDNMGSYTLRIYVVQIALKGSKTHCDLIFQM